jgi:hypothetical protein
MENNNLNSSVLYQEESSEEDKKYKKYIDSFIAFDDGDFIIFYGGYSNLFDGKTLKIKQNLKVGSSSTFFLLSQTQYAINTEDYFEIYDFNEDKTSSKFVQSIRTKAFSSGNKIYKISNGDILLNSFYLGSKDVQVYRKNIDNIYEIQTQFLTQDLEDIIELNNNKELLGYKKNTESMLFKILDRDNYTVVKKQIAQFIVNSKRRIHLKYDLYDYGKLIGNKIIFIGPLNIYIFDTKTLELETTIKFNNVILSSIVKPKEGEIILFCKEQCNFNEKYFMNHIKINYNTNEIERFLEKDITDKIGEHKTLFKIYDYINNGLAVTIEDQKIIIYNDIELSEYLKGTQNQKFCTYI